jgi:hypothetical protein
VKEEESMKKPRKFTTEKLTMQLIDEKGRGDAGLQILLHLWKSICNKMNQPEMYAFALRGIQAALNLQLIKHIYRSHHISSKDEVQVTSDDFPPQFQ